MSKIRESAEQIVEALGGKENISAATHCVTRLRLALKDEGKVDEKALENIDLVKGSFSTNGQFQVVIGQGTVDKVYNEFIDITGTGRASKEDIKDEASKKLNPLQRAIKALADIFIPILPAIVTAGLLMGINNILTGPDIFYDKKSFIDVHQNWADLAGMINLILAGTSALSAYLGITEPAMFGVNLRFRYPFIFAMIGSAIAGIVITVAGVRASSIGVGGIPGFLSILPGSWGSFFIGMGIALVVPFVLTYLYAKVKKSK